LKEEMAWGVAGERRPGLERDRSSRGEVVRCKQQGDGETESAGEVNEWGEEKKRRKKKERGVGMVRASWVSHAPWKF
jgi:hypothetical protein